MEPIEPIGIPNVTIPQVVQRDWLIGVPFVPNNDPPVTLELGFPIVEMPGCVTMHKDNKDHVIIVNLLLSMKQSRVLPC